MQILDLQRRIAEEEAGSKAPALVKAYLALNMISSHFLLPILLCTFLFSKTAKRHPLVINVCVVWILSGIFQVMLLYAGHPLGPEPGRSLCVAQASLLMGTAPMLATSIVCIVWYVRVALSGDASRLNRTKVNLMMAAPYVALIIWTIAALAVTATGLEVSRRSRLFHCSIQYAPLTGAMSAFTGLICVIAIGLEIQLAFIARRSWRALRRAGQQANETGLVIRIFILGVYIFVGLGMDVVDRFKSATIVPDMFSATVGLAIFAIFGIHSDVLRVWCFWRQDHNCVDLCKTDSSAIPLQLFPHILTRTTQSLSNQSSLNRLNDHVSRRTHDDNSTTDNAV